MDINTLNPIKSRKLYGLDKYFKHFHDLYKIYNLPKVILLSGKKGLGKFTLTNHLMNVFFDEKNYLLDGHLIATNSKFNETILFNTNQNITHIKNDENHKLKIDDIRNLKNIIQKSTFNNKPRFFIFDDVETISLNCANALLKIVEEPSKNNFFILINNEQNKLLETLSSRCIETKIFISENDRLEIISNFINFYKIESLINYKDSKITPGNYLKFSYLCLENKIDDTLSYISKITLLLELYKKNKNYSLISLAKFFTEIKYYKLSLNNISQVMNIEKIKNDTIRGLNDFVVYNLNIKTIVNLISDKFNHVK